MKECMLNVHIAMTGSLIFAKNQMPLTMAWMVDVEVVLGVQVDYGTFPSSLRGDVPLHQAEAV
jgi:hypothetical protein